jgi:hypothetical protein
VRVTHEADGRLVEVAGQDAAVVVVGVRREELHRSAQPGQRHRDVGGTAAGVLDRRAVGSFHDVDQRLTDHQHTRHALYPDAPGRQHAHCPP